VLKRVAKPLAGSRADNVAGVGSGVNSVRHTSKCYTDLELLA
jgi:hypothetical protein